MHFHTSYLLSASTIKELKNVALGYSKADMVLVNGNIVDVYTGRILNNRNIAIKGEWIAYTGKNLKHTIGWDTQIIDVSNKYLLPGFIDGHAHLTYYASPYEVLPYIMKGGTTTIITELLEISYCMGYLGIKRFLDAVSDQPIKIFSTVPVPYFLSKSAYEIAPNTIQLKNLLKREDIIGLGESYWQLALNDNNILPELSQETLKLGKSVEGHSAGAHGDKLNAYIAYGISSCHEPISIEDVIERLELGLFTMIREGSIRKELEAISPIHNMNIDTRNIGIITDGIDPRELINSGFLENAVQKAINLGFDPIKAIQMVTINPAEHFHLETLTGGIAPAKHADIIVLPDLKRIQPEYVFSKGKLIAQNGKLLVKPRYYNFSRKGFKNFKSYIKEQDITIKTNSIRTVKVRVIDQVTDLVTREAVIDMTPVNKELKQDISRDILKLTLIDWKGNIFNSFIRGLKLNKGAVASSNIWEAFGIVAIGTNDSDMLTAINRLIRLRGGILVCEDGKIKEELPLPFGGIMSTMPLDKIIEKLNRIQQEAKRIGFPYGDLPRTLAVLTTGAIPFVRITEEGLIDVKNNKKVDLILS